MPLITETYYLSLTQDNRGILRLRCSQDDTLRIVNLKLYNNGSIFTIPSGVSASISGVKQNGAVFSKPCTISQNRENVVLQLSSDITNVDGIIVAEIVLNDGEGGRLGTSNFIIQVEKNPIRAGVIQDTETPIEYINDFIEKIQTLTTRLNNLITPSGDASLAEVVDARIGILDSTTYQTLGARLNAEFQRLSNALSGITILESTGDTTDRTSEILSKLNAYGTCKLGKGDFYVNNLVMPEGSHLVGSGKSTRVILPNAVTNGCIVIPRSNCIVENVSFYGGFTGTYSELIASSNAKRHCIRLNAFDSVSSENVILNNIYINSFVGSAIIQGSAVGCHCENIVIDMCYAGIDISNVSYDGLCTNVYISNTMYGVVQNGSNFVFNGCISKDSKYHIISDQQNTECTFSSCTFFDSNLETTSILAYLSNARNGFVFDNCMFDSSLSMVLNACDGIVIKGTNFVGSDTFKIIVQNGRNTLLLITDCIADVEPTVTNAGTAARITSCYLKDGTAWIISEADITVDDELSDESENPVQNKVINRAIGEIKADLADVNESLGAVMSDIQSVVAPNLGADATWTNGKAVQKSTGNVYSSSNAGASGYIDISGCSSILYMRRVVNSTSAPTSGMAFYDSSKTFIADSGVTDGYKSGGGNPELHEEEVPEGAVYARFSYLRTDAETIADYPFELYDADAYRNATAQTAKEAKKSADDALTYIDGLIEAPSIAPLTGYNMEYDGYIASNGTSITSPTTAKERYTEYIPVESGALYVIDYKVKLESASNFWGQYCKYDSEKAVVGSRTTFPTPTLEADGYYHSYFEISIPTTTAYLRVTARTYGDAILTVYKYVNKSSEIQPSLQVMRKERAEEIAEAIESVSPSTTAIEAFPVVYSPNMYDYVCKGCNHRGYDTYQNYPENTMPAYQASKAHDFYFVETDVQVTSDEEFVLLHDPSINRTARNADGTAIEGTVNINSITLAQAKEYDFGIYQGSTWEGVQIPTLDEFLTYCKKACLHPYLEVKFTYSQSRVRAFVDKVISHGLRNRVTYISGDTEALAEIASYDKTARLGIIYNKPSTGVIDTVLSLRTGCNEVFLDIKTASTDLISACVTNHVPIELWTYDASDSGLLAKPEYVTGITHNKTHAGKLIHNSLVTE